MSALSLLLKPEGIFLKNEMYFENLSRVFHHTIQLHYYDVPLVCSQCLVLGRYDPRNMDFSLSGPGYLLLFSAL